MQHRDLILTTVIEETYLSLEQLAGICAVDSQWVLQHMQDGLLLADRQENGLSYFSAIQLTRAKRILAIERNFEAQPELAALVADLQEELDSLRRQLLRS